MLRKYTKWLGACFVGGLSSFIVLLVIGAGGLDTDTWQGETASAFALLYLVAVHYMAMSYFGMFGLYLPLPLTAVFERWFCQLAAVSLGVFIANGVYTWAAFMDLAIVSLLCMIVAGVVKYARYRFLL